MSVDLRKKLQNLHNDSEKIKIDWEYKKKEWIDSVNLLFETIQNNWFIELERDGLLKIETHPISITEEHIGTYSINKMEIVFPTDNIVLEPVGRNIIGGEGRIDFYLKGEFGKGLMLILFREQEVDKWFLVSKDSRKEKELLSKGSLEETIEQWI